MLYMLSLVFFARIHQLRESSRCHLNPFVISSRECVSISLDVHDIEILRIRTTSVFFFHQQRPLTVSMFTSHDIRVLIVAMLYK